MAKLTQDEILAYLDEATILELNELVKAIEEKLYGTAEAGAKILMPNEIIALIKGEGGVAAG